MTEVIKTLEMLNMAKGVSGKSGVKKDYNHNGNTRLIVLDVLEGRLNLRLEQDPSDVDSGVCDVEPPYLCLALGSTSLVV